MSTNSIPIVPFSKWEKRLPVIRVVAAPVIRDATMSHSTVLNLRSMKTGKRAPGTHMRSESCSYGEVPARCTFIR